MRILELRLKNLNSLKGEWHIDFTNSAYLDDGIFAITGQTGAGKTTILDAICLALYAQTPRIGVISKSSNEVMTRQTGDCFAEVIIEVNKVRYRCRWGQRRAHDKPDGNLQDATHEIVDADTDEILDSALKKTKIRIQTITGMDFEQFTRSILLAQGGFAAFLQAKPDERADILEKITGTDIYAIISMRTFQQLRDEKAELGKLQAKLSGLQLLTPTEVSDYNAAFDTQRHEQQQHKTQLDNLTQHINWLTDIEALNKTIADQQVQLTNAKDAKAQFAPEASRLQAAMRALEIDAEFGKLHAQRVYLQDRRQQKQEIEAELPQQQSKLTAAEDKVTHAQNAEQQASAQWERERPIIAQVRTLDKKLSSVNQALTDKQQQHAGVSERLAQRHMEMNTKEAALADLNQQQEQQQDYLSKHAQDAILANADYGLAGFQRDAAELKKQLHNNAQRLSESKADQDRTADFERTLATLATKLNDNVQSSNQVQHILAQFENKRLDLLKGNSTHQLHQKVAELTGQRQLLDNIKTYYQQALTLNSEIDQRHTEVAPLTATITKYDQEHTRLEVAIASLQQQKRAQQELLETLQALAELQDYFLALQDGKPCALCGSISHPYHDNPPAAFAEVLKAASLGQDISKHEQMQRVIQNIATIEQDINKQNTALNHAQERHIRAQSELQSLQQQVKNLHIQQDTAQNQAHSIINQLRVGSSNFKAIDFKILNPSSVATITTVQLSDNSQFSSDTLKTLLNELQEDQHSLTSMMVDIHKRLEDWEKLEGEINTQQLRIKQIEDQQVQLKQEQVSAQAEKYIVQQRLDSQKLAFAATVNEINTLQTQMAMLLESLEPQEPQAQQLFLPKALQTSSSKNQLSNSAPEALETDTVNLCMDELKTLYFTLKDKLNIWTQTQENVRISAQKIDVLSVSCDALTRQVAELMEQLSVLDNTINTEQQLRDELIDERNLLSTETDIDARAQQLQDTVKQVSDMLVQARQHAESARHQMQYTQNSLDKLVIDIKNTEAQLRHHSETFAQALNEQDFADENKFIAARLDKADRDALLQHDKLLNDNVSQLQTRIDDNQATLYQKNVDYETVNHKASQDFADQPLEVLKLQQQEKQLAYDNIGLKIGGIQQILSDHKANQHSHTEQLRAIEAQQQSSQVWEQLNQLIGQSDGKKYRTFAQGLTFQVMISHANIQLQKMSNRYLLIHDDSSPLELNVIDNYQGGDIRSTKNLSGGEGFIVSLALALGLSQMASHNIRVDSLFLDEGFGTLDEESLDIALDTLTSLQQEGKLIGIISHVQALKERIMTQIHVKKLSGGFSQITGHGCSKVTTKDAV